MHLRKLQRARAPGLFTTTSTLQVRHSKVLFVWFFLLLCRQSVNLLLHVCNVATRWQPSLCLMCSLFVLPFSPKLSVVMLLLRIFSLICHVSCVKEYFRIFCSFPSKIFIQFTIILKIASKKTPPGMSDRCWMICPVGMFFFLICVFLSAVIELKTEDRSKFLDALITLLS